MTPAALTPKQLARKDQWVDLLMNSPQWYTRRRAALVLVDFRTDDIKSLLIDALKSDVDFDVREAAAISLGQFPPAEDIVRALTEASSGDSREEVRFAAATCLSLMETTEF